MCGSSSPEKGRHYLGIRLAGLDCLGLLGGVWLEFIWPVWAIGVIGVQFVPRVHTFDVVYVGA